jgi:hypothetical protein
MEHKGRVGGAVLREKELSKLRGLDTVTYCFLENAFLCLKIGIINFYSAYKTPTMHKA